MVPLVPSRKTSASVLFTHCRRVPFTGVYAGAPRRRINSAGAVLTMTLGVVLPATLAAGSAARTSFQLSSAGSFEKLAGSDAAADHGPFTSAAFSHRLLSRR